MKIKRQRLIALSVAMLAVAVALLWILGGHREEAEEEEEQVTASAPNLSHGPNGEVIVGLSDAEQARVGIRTEPLISVSRTPEVAAYGVILDPTPLGDLDAQLISARAVRDASQAEYQRLKLLHSEKQNASLKDFQAAQAKFLSDQANFDSLRRRLADSWGSAISSLAPPERGRLVDALIARAAAIARVTVPAGQLVGQQPDKAEVIVVGYEGHPLTAQSIWPAPAVDPQFQGQSFMLRVAANGFPLRRGATISVHLEQTRGSLSGVVIPESAIVRTSGGSWAYVKVAGTKFERRPVSSGEATENGRFVVDGFTAGDRIVTHGAQALLSEEFKSQIQVQD